jgi:hypothetical protein
MPSLARIDKPRFAATDLVRPIINFRVKPFALYCDQKPPTVRGARCRNQDQVNQNYSAWKLLYNDAVVELDRIALLAKIEMAQKAIGDRLDDALHGRNPINVDEQQAIEDARHNLYFLKKHPAA